MEAIEPTLSTKLKAEGLALAVQTLFNQKPTVSYATDGSADVYFTPEQIRPLQDTVTELMNRQSMVRVHAEPVLVPVMLKKTWPIIAGIAVSGFLAGYLVTRKTRRPKRR